MYIFKITLKNNNHTYDEYSELVNDFINLKCNNCSLVVKLSHNKQFIKNGNNI